MADTEFLKFFTDISRSTCLFCSFVAMVFVYHQFPVYVLVSKRKMRISRLGHLILMDKQSSAAKQS